MDSDPHPVTCPTCGMLIGYELQNGCLKTPLGIITHMAMVHGCGRKFFWSAQANLVEKWAEEVSHR